MEIVINSATWPTTKHELTDFFPRVVEGWRHRQEAEREQEVVEAEKESEAGAETDGS